MRGLLLTSLVVTACGGDEAAVREAPRPAADAPPLSPSASPAPAQAPAARADLYDCEGCEAALERDAAGLTWSARMAGEDEPGERLLVRGRVLQADGRTPAAGVVLYVHHTNAAGLYAGGTSESVWSQRHGRLRAWVRTGADGRWELHTVKPAPYPGREFPAHIHFIVAEEGRTPYWIDDIVFAGEHGVDDAYRAKMEDRGGSGIVTLGRTPDGTLLAERTILLERHPAR